MITISLVLVVALLLGFAFQSLKTKRQLIDALELVAAVCDRRFVPGYLLQTALIERRYSISDSRIRRVATNCMFVAGWLLAFCAISLPAAAQTNEQRSLILVVGAAGEPEFGEKFAASAELWKQAAMKAGFQTTVIGQNTNSAMEDRSLLLTALTNGLAGTNGELWLVLIGHGSFDGKAAKFNLTGPDISAEDLAATLKSNQRSLAVIDCASASGPFLNALSASNRVIVTATRSGYEANVTRFGDYFARAIGDSSADLDKDGQTSLLECYLLASRQVEQFYKEQGRLATEHALLDDNGDSLGTPAEWFVGVRAVKKAENGKSVDGIRAHQMNFIRGTQEQQLSAELRARRDALEQKLNALRERKPTLKEDAYYRELEGVLLEIARLYQPSIQAAK